MGIDYTKGQRGFASTAGGVVPANRVSLDAVTVGEITLYRVDASVFEGGLDVALLGMSFFESAGNEAGWRADGTYQTVLNNYRVRGLRAKKCTESKYTPCS